MLLKTPIGYIRPLDSQIQRVQIMSDKELCNELNLPGHKDPCAFTEAENRVNINYEWRGRGYYVMD